MARGEESARPFVMRCAMLRHFRIALIAALISSPMPVLKPCPVSHLSTGEFGIKPGVRKFFGAIDKSNGGVTLLGLACGRTGGCAAKLL